MQGSEFSLYGTKKKKKKMYVQKILTHFKVSKGTQHL